MLDQGIGRGNSGGITGRDNLVQHRLSFPNKWGGRRKGAGPKPKSGRAGVRHSRRVHFAEELPAHVTLKLREGLPTLRKPREYQVILGAFLAASERDDFRVVHHSVQGDHMHLIVEADGRRALSLGMQGLGIRIARRLNRLWQRTGKVFADRYHDRILRSPREVIRVLNYVLNNARKHGWSYAGVDGYCSGRWFAGVRKALRRLVPEQLRPKTWLLAESWRRFFPFAPSPPAASSP